MPILKFSCQCGCNEEFEAFVSSPKKIRKYKDRSHYQKWYKDNGMQQKMVEASKAVNRGLIASKRKAYKESDKQVTKMTDKVKAKAIPYFNDVQKAVKEEVQAVAAKYGVGTDSVQVLQFVEKMSKSIVIDLYKQYKYFLESNLKEERKDVAQKFVRDFARSVLEYLDQLRKTAKDMHEIQYGKRVILEKQEKKPSIEILLTEDNEEQRNEKEVAE